MLRILDGDAAQLHRAREPAMRDEVYLGSHFRTLVDAMPHMGQKSRNIVFGHVIDKGIAGQRVAIHAEELCPGEVDFLNVTVLVQRRVSQRCEIIEIDVTVAIVLQIPLRPHSS